MRMVVEGHGMGRARGKPEGARAMGLGCIELMDHGGGDIGVGSAMDKKDGKGGTAHLTEGRGFLERPAVAELAEPGGDIHEGMDREAELVMDLAGELVPDAGIAAVVDDATDGRGEAVARTHQDTGSAHGDAMEEGGGMGPDGVGDMDPLLEVETVVPAHLYLFSPTLAMTFMVGKEDIETKGVVIEAA